MSFPSVYFKQELMSPLLCTNAENDERKCCYIQQFSQASRTLYLISQGMPLKAVMQTHSDYGKSGSLNHFYTLGSFPDSRFIQLKSRSGSQLCSNMRKYFQRHFVVRTLTWFSKFSHCNNFLRLWHYDLDTLCKTHDPLTQHPPTQSLLAPDTVLGAHHIIV